MKLAPIAATMTLIAVAALLSACASLDVSTQGSERATPGAQLTQGARS